MCVCVLVLVVVYLSFICMYVCTRMIRECCNSVCVFNRQTDTTDSMCACVFFLHSLCVCQYKALVVVTYCIYMLLISHVRCCLAVLTVRYARLCRTLPVTVLTN